MHPFAAPYSRKKRRKQGAPARYRNQTVEKLLAKADLQQCRQRLAVAQVAAKLGFHAKAAPHRRLHKRTKFRPLSGAARGYDRLLI
jgi:hypothetical protein